uniref:Uncharacterized protein n=1 Tax=Anopheles maculatus TaxID=74869 RepID=A0A182SCS5_9DIPT
PWLTGSASLDDGKAAGINCCSEAGDTAGPAGRCTTEAGQQYVLRAVATLLIKPIQSVLEMAPQNKATALNSQIHLLFRRGLSEDACKILWDALIPRALRIKMPGGGGVGIPVGVAVKDYLKGGLDLGPPMTMAFGGVATQPIPAPVPATQALEKAIPRHMTNDWVAEVSKSIGGAFDAPALAEALHAGNVADSLRPIDRMMSMRRLEKEIKEWKGKIGSLSGQAMGTRVALALRGAEDIPAKQIGERLNHTIVCYMKSGAEAGRAVAIVDTLMAGIATSPLRDVASARMALKMSIAGFLLYLKVLLQEVWRAGVGWDDEIPSNLQEKWKEWLACLPLLQTVKIPRCYRSPINVTDCTIQLHVCKEIVTSGRSDCYYKTNYIPTITLTLLAYNYPHPYL